MSGKAVLNIGLAHPFQPFSVFLQFFDERRVICRLEWGLDHGTFPIEIRDECRVRNHGLPKQHRACSSALEITRAEFFLMTGLMDSCFVRQKKLRALKGLHEVMSVDLV